MTMFTKGNIIPLEQNTEEWLRWRDTGIGGSDAGVIKLGNVYGKTPGVLWAQKMGITVAEFTEAQREHIDRGHALEPEARQRFADLTGFRVRPVCMQSATYPFMLASIDGLTHNGDVGVEIKAPAEKMFKSLLDSNQVPAYYYAQIQHQLAVSGAREFYFWAYNPNVKPGYFIKRVDPDYAYIEQLIRLEEQFQWHVDRGISPTEDGTVLDMQRSGGIFTGLIMLSGYATAGKDMVGEIYTAILGAKRFSPSDPLREIYCQMRNITHKRLNDEKERHRPALVALGHGMRQYVPDVWIDAVFNPESGIFEAMQDKGALITSARYVNELSHGRKHAARLGVPCHSIYIDRPKVKAANETEAATLPLCRDLCEVTLVNDMDVNTEVGYAATELAALSALRVGQSSKLTIHSSDYKELARNVLKQKREVKRESRGKKTGHRVRS